MENERFKPLIDKLFWIILIPTALLLIAVTIVAAFTPTVLFIMIPTDLFTLYFLISPLFGYLELREDSVFIKFGFIMKKEIPYRKIRGFSKERKIYSDSITSLKNSIEHVNIKYNSFDMVSVSVRSNDDLIEKIKARISNKS